MAATVPAAAAFTAVPAPPLMLMPSFLPLAYARMIDPLTGNVILVTFAGAVCLPTSATDFAGFVGTSGVLATATTVSFFGKGLAALGGVGVGDPLPGACMVAASRWRLGGFCLDTGINRNWPSRMAKSLPRLFHSANDLAET